MAEYSNAHGQNIPKHPRVYRVKSAPFENPFAHQAKDFTASVSQVSMYLNKEIFDEDIVAPEPVVARRVREKQNTPAKTVRKPMSLTYAITLCICIVVFTFSSFLFVMELIPQIIAKKQMDEARNFKIPSQTTVASAGADQVKREVPDFDALKDINKDIVGWGYLEEASIDHPIVKGTDNDYYLTHMYNKSSNSSGSVFMDYRANSDFTSQNTVIYGHSMKNGTMFAKLKKYKEQASYDKQPVISIYSPGGKVYHYQIFASVLVDPFYDYRKPDYGSNFSNFVKKLKSQSLIKSNATVTSNDRVLGLSTCSGNNSEYRFVVFGVLLNKDGNDIDISSIKP